MNREIENSNYNQNYASLDDLIVLISKKFNDLLQLNKTEISELSKYTGISQAGLRRIRRGEGNPTISIINKLACYFGVPITYFFIADKKELITVGLKSIPIYGLDLYPNKQSNRMIVTKEINNLDSDYVIEIVCDSFSPVYSKNTLLYVKSFQLKEILCSGLIYFICSNHGNTLQRYIEINDQKIFQSLKDNSLLKYSSDIKIYGHVITSSVA